MKTETIVLDKESKIKIRYRKKDDVIIFNMPSEVQLKPEKAKRLPDLLKDALRDAIEAVLPEPEEPEEVTGPINVQDIAETLEEKPESIKFPERNVTHDDAKNVVSAIAEVNLVSDGLKQTNSEISKGIQVIKQRCPDKFDLITVSEQLREMGSAAKTSFVEEIADFAIKEKERTVVESRQPKPQPAQSTGYGSSR